ncbi:hypothetical protein [Microbacterium sp. ZW T5_56]|uniref:hypothetical protein n=1 Tax=Microbacterium sp. ZW T5_56 TaxID=3378081 RepID=UPI00385562D5
MSAEDRARRSWKREDAPTEPTMTEAEWQAQGAAETAVLSHAVDDPADVHIVLLDTAWEPVIELDKHAAIALAARLLDLALQVPEPRFTLPLAVES